MITASVSGSSLKSFMTSMCFRPFTGSPPMPTQRRLAEAERRELADGFVGQRARARHDADAALAVDVAGHDADLELARRDDARAVRADQPRALALHAVLVRIMSRTGMPSVMQITSSRSASTASSIAAAANGGGT